MRDLDKKPYSADEAKIAKFFCDRGVGGGDDPVGSLLCGYAYLIEQRKRLQTSLRDCVSFMKDDISGPSQRSGIIAEAEAALDEA